MECHFNDRQTSSAHSSASLFPLETRKTSQTLITDETDDHSQQFANAPGQVSPQISRFVGASS
jgi:hypothetical protein